MCVGGGGGAKPVPFYAGEVKTLAGKNLFKFQTSHTHDHR